uniref:Uncharacterized protein n=1 Tax=Arundo donax TaxID=35708 RepID=A0A0A8Y573_ARUDO
MDLLAAKSSSWPRNQGRTEPKPVSPSESNRYSSKSRPN